MQTQTQILETHLAEIARRVVELNVIIILHAQTLCTVPFKDRSGIGVEINTAHAKMKLLQNYAMEAIRSLYN